MWSPKPSGCSPIRVSRRAFLLAAAGAARAQFTSSVRVVNIYVTVRDRRGALVRDLTRQDFEIYEDGRRQTLRYFSAHSDAPLTLGLLFDVSGSQRAVLERQKETALAFLARLLREGDTAFLAAFDRDVTLFDPAHIAALTTARSGSGGTALFDAVVRAAQHLAAEPGRKALVILSDGIDTASTARLGEAVTAAQRASAAVFPIRFYDRQVFQFAVPGPALENLNAGRRALERLAKDTGGALYEVVGARSLEDNFAQLEEELRAQYSLGFTPANGRPGYRKLRVHVRRRGVRVQARDGYFSE
jgi:VWFA-related protein